MKIDIVGRNYKISDKLRDLIQKKVERFDKFFDKQPSVKVVCSAQKDRYKMELNLTSGSMFIRSEVETDNMYANLDLCLARLEKQVIKYSDKNWKSRNKKKFKEADNLELDYFDEIPELLLPSITKRKMFTLEPMTENEALIQMDMVGNDFFIFKNSDTNSVCVLYKREDGNIGFIETK